MSYGVGPLKKGGCIAICRGDETLNRAFFLLIIFISLLATPALAMASSSKTSDKSSSERITEIRLERISGGPQFTGNGWPQDRIVLRPQTKDFSSSPDEFRRLAQWLQKSGFFTRKSGYRTSSFPSDVGYLVITAVRGSYRKQVYSYNGSRDAEFWQTEMVIRGVAETLKLQSSRSVWLKTHKTP